MHVRLLAVVEALFPSVDTRGSQMFEAVYLRAEQCMLTTLR